MLNTQSKIVLVMMLFLLLTGCGGVLVTYQDKELSENDIAVLEGYHRYYFVYFEEADISSIDGIRPAGVLDLAKEAHLLPGTHLVGLVLQNYFGGGGGYTGCAFEDQFDAGYRYKLKPHGTHSEEPWYRRPPSAWKQSMAIEVWNKGVQKEIRQVQMICFGGTPDFCREDRDCIHHPASGCVQVTGETFGTCK